MQSKRSPTAERVAFWLNPDKVEITEETTQAWLDFTENLRNQYTTFARIFEEIEQASFTGRDVVEKSVPYIENLIAQLAYFANSIDKNPPIFLDRRAALIAELDKIRDSDVGEVEKRRQAAEWRDRWLALISEEDELKRSTIEQCHKAITIGYEIRKLMLAYNKVSLDDISNAANTAFFLAGTLTGEDFSRLRARTETYFAEIKNDGVWNRATNLALNELNKAIKARSKQEKEDSAEIPTDNSQ